MHKGSKSHQASLGQFVESLNRRSDFLESTGHTDHTVHCECSYISAGIVHLVSETHALIHYDTYVWLNF